MPPPMALPTLTPLLNLPTNYVHLASQSHFHLFQKSCRTLSSTSPTDMPTPMAMPISTPANVTPRKVPSQTTKSRILVCRRQGPQFVSGFQKP